MTHSVEGHAPTAAYLAVLDDAGEMAVAVNDMAVLAELDSVVIADCSGMLRDAAAVVADCNLSSEALAAVAGLGGDLFVDTVSVAKAARILPHLDCVHTLKPNRLETELLTGAEITDERTLRDAARRLLDAGVMNVVISLGGDGALAAHGADVAIHRAPRLPVVSVTGAGDALMAGLVHAHVQGWAIDTATRFGLAAAALTAASPHTIADELDPTTVADLMEDCA
jgi:pseudouridine kinase